MLKKLLLPFAGFLLFLLPEASAQLETQLDGREEGRMLIEVLEELEEKYDIEFFYLPEWINTVSIDKDYAGQTVESLLADLFKGTDLDFFAMYDYAIVIVKDPKQEQSRLRVLRRAIANNSIIERLTIGSASDASKERVVLSGVVKDFDGNPLPFATIRINSAGSGEVTDADGRFSLELSPGAYALIFSFVDHEDKFLDLVAYADGEIEIVLERELTVLDEVVIEAESIQALTTKKVGTIQLDMTGLKRAPTFLGETDLIKQIQSLPGVTSVGEAAMGFNVRGGSVDQNLVLYDGLPVFNSSHVFGFFSSFHPASVRKVSFYNGGIPAEFGGRASSVLDIESINGNQSKLKGEAGIGLITSNFMLHGPLKNRKTTFFTSFRSTYSDWLVKSLKTDFTDLSKSSVSFYDASMKVSHLLTDNSRLSVSGYSSRDGFSLTGDTTYRWSNFLISSQFDHVYQSGVEVEATAGISRYGYEVENADSLSASELSFQILSSVLKGSVRKKISDHALSAGLELTHYQLNPGQLRPRSALSTASRFSLDRQRSIETAVYISDDFSYRPNVTVSAGLRIPIFMSFGSANVNTYEQGAARELSNIADTLQFGPSELIKTYAGLEPRFSVNVMLTSESSLKFGYHRIYQFLHLVTNTASVAPVDIWQPSGYHIKPQIANQFSVGYFKESKDKKYGVSVESFYKNIQNILDFEDGTQLILNENIEADLLQGKAISYGLETSFFKNTGRLTGSLNYTYSRALRKVSGFPEELINDGDWYAANHDQPNVVNLSWKYNISTRHFFTGNFTYRTGRPITVPLSAFEFESTSLAYFSERNSERIPDYHRLDLALVIEGNHKLKKWWDGTWIISIYNVYARRNPYSVFFRNSDSGVPRPFQLSIVGTAFPSLTYKMTF